MKCAIEQYQLWFSRLFGDIVVIFLKIVCLGYEQNLVELNEIADKMLSVDSVPLS